MKKLELEQLANRLIEIAETLKNLNRLIEIAETLKNLNRLIKINEAETLKNLNKPEDFVKGRWSSFTNIYIHKSGIGFDSLKNFRTDLNNNTASTSPVTDFTELTELLKAEVLKRIGKGKPIGVRDVMPLEQFDQEPRLGTFTFNKTHSDEIGRKWWYNQETDTLYNYGSGLAIVYENGVFATVANDMQAKLEEAKLKYPNGTEFKGAITKNIFRVYKGVTISEVNPKYIRAIDRDGEEKGLIYDGDSDTWSEIISQDPIILDGKEVEIEDELCCINDIWFGKHQIETLQSLNPIFTEILKRMEEKNG